MPTSWLPCIVSRRTPMSLTVDSVSKKFGRYPALNGASFKAPQGGFVSLLGPSGSGKTTLLRMLLLDEPFGALDAKVRKELRADLRRIHDHAGVTTVFVTHDQEEAFGVADLVAVMKDGRIEQYGAPSDVRRNPKTAFVSEFLMA